MCDVRYDIMCTAKQKISTERMGRVEGSASRSTWAMTTPPELRAACSVMECIKPLVICGAK